MRIEVNLLLCQCEDRLIVLPVLFTDSIFSIVFSSSFVRYLPFDNGIPANPLLISWPNHELSEVSSWSKLRD